MITKNKSLKENLRDLNRRGIQYPIHEVAPSAVRIAEAIDAISCTTNLMVSFFVIMVKVLIG